MKNISLKNLKSFGIEIISKEDLKSIYGGTGCVENHFMCSDGTCVDRSRLFNGIADCPDGSDEGAGGAGCIYIGKGDSHSCWYVSNAQSPSSMCNEIYGGNCDYQYGPQECNEYCSIN